MERFRVIERIGSGGMGTVYRAYDERLQREVALKELEPSTRTGSCARPRQPRASTTPSIVTLYELGEHAGHACSSPSWFRARPSPASRRRADSTIATSPRSPPTSATPLAHAHARGVVHRDIKPQNVIVREDRRAGRRAKLMDFGIARIAGAPTLTAAGEVVGTLAYMSPEQADGELAGPETDVYSLALTAYECWAGTNPVAGRTPAQTARRIGTGVPPLRVHRPDLPEGLADTIDACLEPEPELRPSRGSFATASQPSSAASTPCTPLPGPDGRRPRPGDRRPASAAPGCSRSPRWSSSRRARRPGRGPGAALVLARSRAALAGRPARPRARWRRCSRRCSMPPGSLRRRGPRRGGLTALARAALGAGAWAWMLAASLALGAGPELGIGSPATSGWATDASAAADQVLSPLFTPASLLGAGVFALAAVALGWALSARHLPLALLGAMLWAAGVDAALNLVGNGALGGHPVGSGRGRRGRRRDRVRPAARRRRRARRSLQARRADAEPSRGDSPESARGFPPVTGFRASTP